MSVCSDRKWEVLALGVAELYRSSPNARHDRWSRAHCGVVCFIKDNVAHAFFIRLFDFDKSDFIWEQELFLDFSYSTPLSYFHTFEADDCQAGLNFAYEAEAEGFHTAVEQRLEARRRKREERRRCHSAIQPTVPKHDPQIPCSANGVSNQYVYKKHKYGKKSKNKKVETKLTKEDIGSPMDFKHVQHVGWDPNKGFDFHNVVDKELNKFFEMASVSEQDLNDETTRKFIYDFIERNGGIDAIKDVSKPPSAPAVPPQVPTREQPPPPLASRVHPPPSNVRVAPRPTPHGRGPAPRQLAPHGAPVSNGTGVAAPPPPPPPLPTGGHGGGKGAPPPPPPPPPPPDFCPPKVNGSAPPPAPPPGLPAAGDTMGALLDQIRKGKTLNHVDPETESLHSNPDNRGTLLDQIRGGVQLKSVQDNPRVSPTENKLEGLAGALARALQERARACLPDDSDSSDGSDEDEDDWDD